eukprot:CAMPEP_0177663414 /NCGR_PEP_ID=MMETSP0447-20121125/19898_1 /TAXON_ID=0 /ORGANISM="Stygamoeba regulata, Strain BSH-02190019" /LENGTH=183 /DNA_ID=CAMNT_0019169219 /DNA_START=32 /DNA_END=583 /DNA_ORIENTATION=+
MAVQEPFIIDTLLERLRRYTAEETSEWADLPVYQSTAVSKEDAFYAHKTQAANQAAALAAEHAKHARWVETSELLMLAAESEESDAVFTAWMAHPSVKTKPCSFLAVLLSLLHALHLRRTSGDTERICAVLKDSFDAAISELDTLDDHNYRAVTVLMQLQRDFLVLLTSEDTAEDGALTKKAL